MGGPLARAEPDLDYLHQVVRYLRSNGFTPILCVDEFEGLLHEETFDLRMIAEAPRAAFQEDGLSLRCFL